MGVYAFRTTEGLTRNGVGGEFWEEVESTPGLTRRRLVVAHPWVETRTDCYCCSCPDGSGGDAACRNHGWAAKRPCETHKMPGSPWDHDGRMPASVQAHVTSTNA